MIRSLPERPLEPAEAVGLSKQRSNFVLLPATPDSLFDDDNRVTDVRDLLILTENVLVTVVYEDGDGWTIVSKSDDTTRLTEAITAVVDYRDYSLSETDVELIVSEYEGLIDRGF